MIAQEHSLHGKSSRERIKSPIRSKLIWGSSIVGNVKDCVNSSVTSLCHRISVKELPSLTPLICIKTLEADFADTGPGERGVSQDDIQFLNILKANTHKNESGHIEMPLPFKVRPTLPHNRKLAIIWLKQLKKKTDTNPKFKEDYIKFKENILKDGNIEIIDCHTWWILKMQSDTLEERYAIKFCFKLEKNTIETYGMLQTAFRPSCMNRASVFEWHKRFKEGTECEGWWEVWEE